MGGLCSSRAKVEELSPKSAGDSASPKAAPPVESDAASKLDAVCVEARPGAAPAAEEGAPQGPLPGHVGAAPSGDAAPAGDASSLRDPAQPSQEQEASGPKESQPSPTDVDAGGAAPPVPETGGAEHVAGHAGAGDSAGADAGNGGVSDSPPAPVDASGTSAAEGTTGAEVQGSFDPDATAALIAAVEGEEWEEACKLLRRESGSGPCDPNVRTGDFGYSLLRAAAEDGAAEVCDLLLQQRADANMRDPNGMTPLMGCVVGGDTDAIVAMLLEARADPSLSTDDGFTALSWATRLDREAAIKRLRAAGMTGKDTCF